MMYENPAEEIISFDEFAYSQHSVSKEEAEQWFLDNADQVEES